MKNKNVVVLQVKKYNQLEMTKWRKRTAEWKKISVYKPMPQLAMYGFRLANGEFKNKGWVVVFTNIGVTNGAQLFKNKQLALAHKARLLNQD